MKEDSWIGDVLRCRFAWSEIEPSVALLEAIRVYEAEGHAGPGGLTEPLGHHIDTDALDTLVKSDRLLVVGLRLEDYRVEISENVVHVTVSDHVAH